MIEVTCEHIAANCNPMPNAIDFLSSDYLVFCFKNQVGVYDLPNNRILMNLNHRLKNPNRANCLKVLSNLKDSEEIGKELVKDCILVGYDSGEIVLYQILSNLAELKVSQRKLPTFRILQVFSQSQSTISFHLISNVLITNDNAGEITEYAIDFKKLEIAKQSEKLVPEVQIISEIKKLKFPLNKIIESIATFTFGNTLIMFLGGVDQKIHTYSCELGTEKSEFQYCFPLVGHENAITKMTLIREKESKLDQFLLASASKDGYIRIWRITANEEITKFHKNVKTLEFINQNKVLKIFLESVLISHECSVTNLQWINFRERTELASCSLDCTICLWGRQKEEDGNESWVVKNRMGQLLGNKNAYFDIIVDPKSRFLLALNYIGSALIWEYKNQTDKFTLRESFTGHSNEVKGLDWNHTGSFLATVSKDQTTRVLAQNHSTKQFAQISRAQIHGYDINAVSVIKVKENTIDVIACGADQKVIRIVQPTACFANYLNSFTKRNLHLYFKTQEEENRFIKVQANSQKNQPLIYQTYSEGGVQVLGLMTKMQRVERQKIVSYYEEQEQPIQEEQQVNGKQKPENLVSFQKPANDDYLIKHTLWPEMNKLYGHPHEIQYLTKNPEGTLLASSCIALNKESATVIIWDIANNWKILKMIQHHSYTVFRMEFTRDGKYLITVSKDRKMAVFLCEDRKFDLVFGYQAHARAVTSVSANYDSALIVTGSRDKTVKIHDIGQRKVIDQLNLGQGGIFSVAFGYGEKVRELILCGDQTGNIFILKVKPLTIVYQIPDAIGHTEVINHIKWRGDLEEFASCSNDHSVKIFKVWLQ